VHAAARNVPTAEVEPLRSTTEGTLDRGELKLLAAAEKVAKYRHAQLSAMRLSGDLNARPENVNLDELLESIRSELVTLGPVLGSTWRIYCRWPRAGTLLRTFTASPWRLYPRAECTEQPSPSPLLSNQRALLRASHQWLRKEL
jgi:hypothetical protein